jgi:ABC-2 type transport system ATP-binding protein
MTATFPSAVHVSGLRKAYGEKVVLDGIDLDVATGTIFALLGPNGAGKTTTIKILSTLIGADSGEIRVAGHDPDRHPDGVRAAIGVTGQFSAVDSLLTGEENLALMADLDHHLERPERRRRVRALLERFDLLEAANRPAATYSGGMRRRLDLGASLVGAPRLLLLDEPTTGLDPRSRIELWDAIRTLVEAGTDVLLTTQYLDEADHLASEIVIIDHGRAVAAGSPRELKRQIGGSVIELHVASAEDLGRAAAALQRLDTGAVQIDEPTHRVSVGVPSGSEALMAALQSVYAAGIEVDDIALRQPNLDEVFLALTGQPREAPEAHTPSPHAA